MQDNAIRQQLRNELLIGLSHCELDPGKYFKVETSKRSSWLKDQHVKLHAAFLKWAMRAGMVEEHYLKNPCSLPTESHLRQYLVGCGLVTFGAGGSATVAATGIALGTVTSVAVVPASGWLGYFAFTTLACTTQTITTTAAVTTAWTVAAVAAPLAVMGATAYGYYRYQKNAEFRRVANAFEEEKNKIREFYQQQIEKASSPICVPVFSH